MEKNIKNICETYFSIIEDKRCECNVKYKLSDILIIVMCAIISGIDVISDIAEYGKNKSEMLKKVFNIEKIPSEITILRVLSIIDVDMLNIALTGIFKEFVKSDKKIEVINIDGKVIKSTEKMEAYSSSLQILTAYATELGICLEQMGIYEKTNEIPVARDMLDMIDIKGKIVTFDALHCQKETLKKVVDKKGYYIVGLKENQKSFYKEIELMYQDLINSKYIKDKEKYEEYEITEKNKGRIETRKIYKLKDISWSENVQKWPEIKSIIMVRRIVEEKGEIKQEDSYYISNLESSIYKLLMYIREHWKIESMHYMLDVIYNEDKCRVINENTQKVLNVMRKIGLTFHKNYIEKKGIKSNIKKNMFKCLLNDELLLDVINNFYYNL